MVLNSMVGNMQESSMMERLQMKPDCLPLKALCILGSGNVPISTSLKIDFFAKDWIENHASN